MNRKNIQPWLTPAALTLGAGAFVLRQLAAKLAVDEKGLLIRGHWLAWLLLIVTLAGLVLVLLPDKALRGRSARREALGALAAALGIALTVPAMLEEAGTSLDGIHLGLAAVAATAMLAAAALRWRGRPSPWLSYGAVCLFLVIHLVCRYRVWSAQPEMLRYVYDLLGALGMLVFSYLRCVTGHVRLRRGVALAGAVCCLAGAGLTGFGPMYLGGAAWLLAEQDAPGEVEWTSGS